MTTGNSKSAGSGWDTARIRRALRTVTDPVSGQSIIDLGCVVDIQLPGTDVALIELSPEKLSPTEKEAVREAAVKAALALGGIARVDVRYTGEQAAPAVRLERSTSSRRKAPVVDAAQKSTTARPEGARYILAISSAKGGVGKSTVALNLARAFAANGYRAGLLDADVYGPSVPTMTGLKGTVAGVGANELIAPVDVDGVEVMSMGFIVPEGKSVPWRGPMVMNALLQMLSGVDWGELDYLLIDMPPGTGDVALTLVQQAALDGAVIVSTPQEVALADVRRGVEFFEKANVPILGVIENMSFLKDAATGADIDLFGRGGARAEAERLRVPFLGEVPFDIDLRKSADAGKAVSGAIGRIFQALAGNVNESAARSGKRRKR